MIIDFHSHILPGIDDGSRSVKESLEMLRQEAEQGIKTVVATPHFYPQHHTPQRFLEKRKRAEEKLREELVKYPELPNVEIGAEVYFFSGISQSEVITELTISGNSCILLEMPDSPWSDRMYQEIRDIHKNFGITPIIAHVERYFGPFRTYGIPEKLAEMPVLVQSNANFFLRSGSRRTALNMLRKQQIHLIGSDCHNLTSRPPNLGEAVQVIDQRIGPGALRWIESNQNKVLAGE